VTTAPQPDSATAPRKVRPVTYANWHSRVFLKGMFERQYNVPEAPPWLLERFLMAYERSVMRIDIPNRPLDRPIFILGLPRSGSTMLQDLCCAHPDVGYITNAMHQFPRCFCAAEMWRRSLRLDARGERYVGDSVEVSAATPNEGLMFFGHWFGWDPHELRYTPRPPESFTEAEIADIHKTLHKVLWCFRPHATRFFNKNPALIPDVAILNRVFPDARFVHLVRDPRNCANSLLKLYWADKRQLEFIRSVRQHGLYDDRPFIPYPRVPHLQEFVNEFGAADLRTTAHIWREAVEMIDAYKPQFRHYHEVRFEDILQNPQQEMDRLVAFCELPPIAADNAEYWDRFRKIGVTHHQNRYDGFDAIEAICREPMQRLGYL
jgi:hypothetical protein